MAGSWSGWHADDDGALKAQAHGFGLVVRPANPGDSVRFTVMRDGPIGAGQAKSVRAAMKEAVGMAERFARPVLGTGRAVSAASSPCAQHARDLGVMLEQPLAHRR